jgi:alkylation response protein AidB-like acyl-CoA dehydrogenase
MNFDLTETQAMLKALVERFGAEAHGHDLEKRRFQRSRPGGFDRANWAKLAELGLTALPFAEADGGIGGGPVELIAVAEPLGHSLATEPFTECLVPAASLFGAIGTGQRAALAGALIAGEMLPALAVTEQAGRYNLAHVETRAREAAGGWLLSGAKNAVWQGMAADALIVSARVSGDGRSPDGIGLFVVQADAAGLDRRGWRAADGQLAAEIVLHETLAVQLDGLSLPALEEAVRTAWLSASAEMLGCAGLLFDQTLGYVKQRTQFGKTLGSFQVIQHRLTDCYVALEQARSMVYRAALAPAQERPRAWAGAKAFVSDAARSIAHESVQFHGGMGVTDELLVGHGLKRIQLLSRLWGDPETAASQFAKAA